MLVGSGLWVWGALVGLWGASVGVGVCVGVWLLLCGRVLVGCGVVFSLLCMVVVVSVWW